MLKSESYCNFELPNYIDFDKILKEIHKKMNGKNISDFFNRKTNNPRDLNDLNHIIYNNKDGKYAWRPLQLIHPVLYVSLVKEITKEENWQAILMRFRDFSRNPKIKCISYPVESLTNQKDKAEQILHWWHEVEQKSIEFALDYEYSIHTDITDCYGSIYTHSIAWALHGKDIAKKNRKKIGVMINLLGILLMIIFKICVMDRLMAYLKAQFLWILLQKWYLVMLIQNFQKKLKIILKIIIL